MNSISGFIENEPEYLLFLVGIAFLSNSRNNNTHTKETTEIVELLSELNRPINYSCTCDETIELMQHPVKMHRPINY